MPGPSRTPGSRRDSKTEWTVLPAAGRVGPAPKLPSRRPAFQKATREWWSTLWSTPQATQWAENDQTLIRLALMVDQVNVGTASAAILSEIRQIEDRYGLNPKALVQLRWRIEDVDAVPTVEQPAGVADLTEQRRKRLAAG